MRTQPLLLSIETASRAGSIAIVKGNEVLASSSGNAEISHSNTLLADIDALLSDAALTIRDVEIFGVASGPGSFTGLRIGVATVKAFAETLNRPCVGVPTLEAIAHSAGGSAGTVALLPAGRGELFVQRFSVSIEQGVVALDEPAHLSPASIIERYKDLSSICWAGDGAHLYVDLIRDSASTLGYEFEAEWSGNSNRSIWSIARPTSNLAQHVASLALSAFESIDDASPNSLHAIYVRPSDAELK